MSAISICSIATPIWKLNTNNAHEDLATWAQELIEANIYQLPDGEYAFTLHQKDDAMTIHYDVVGKDIEGELSTEYAWEGLESLVEDVFNMIEQQIKGLQVQDAVNKERTQVDDVSLPQPKNKGEIQESPIITETNNTHANNSELSIENNEKSYIYIRRPFQYMGAGLNHYLEVNGENIGNLISGGCVLIVTNPGYIAIKDYYGLIGYNKLKEKGRFLNISLDVKTGEKVYFKMNEALLKYEKEVGKENKYEPQTTVQIK